MRASIIIAAHNEGESLAKTVRSVIESTSHLDYEIIVADDASFDGSVKDTERRFPQVRVVRHEQRQGASPAKHLGARHAHGEVLVFLDGHTKPETGAVKRLVEDVEWLGGQAIITPAVPALDTRRWRNRESQVGHGYRLTLEKFDCGWVPLSAMKQVGERGRKFHESPALIGCALAVSRELYEDLWGFDAHMLAWGVEDLDFGLKSWLMGHRILHDPEAVIGHRFRERFDNYDVPFERLIVNQLRMARKNFTQAVWNEWVEGCRKRHTGRLSEHPEGLWAHAWSLFEADLASANEERAYLLARRVRDEFWYADKFGLTWPTFRVGLSFQATAADEPAPSPSPSPCPIEIKFSPNPVKLGFTKPVATSELRRFVTVNISPHAAAAAVTLAITGQPRATIYNEDRSQQDQGLITLYLQGIQQTPSTKPQGDTWVEAKHSGMVCGKLPIIVVIPKTIGKPHPEPSGPVAGVNLALDRKSSPAWTGALLPTQVVLVSAYPQWLDIQVNDQFDDPLNSIYAGLDVEERVGAGLWWEINQKMTSGGTYLDPVGPFMFRGGSPAAATVLRNSAAAAGWPTAPVIPLVANSQVQNIRVRVGGHELSPIPAVTDRTWRSTLPSNVEIDWPD